MDMMEEKLGYYPIFPNAHKCYKGEGKYELVLGYGSFLCSMCRDPHKSIDLVFSEEELENEKQNENNKRKK